MQHHQKLAIIIFSAIVFFATVSSALVQIQPFIIGGHEVDVAKHPYLISIRYRLVDNGPYWHKCAGVIVSEHAVLTAAQCIREIQTDRVMIVAAANRRTGGDGQHYPATKWIGHAEFSTYTADYDIGLLFVDLPFEFTADGATLRSINIRRQRPAAGHLATVVGWGYREEFGPSSNYLKEIQVPIVSQSECVSIYGVGEVTERMICAGFVNGGHDACQGDTGGPLIYNGELVGLVSWGRGCGRPGYPSGYTYVDSLRSWIGEQLEKNTGRGLSVNESAI
ncbi:trypsin eta-like [Eurosta solidaginis]|uniref:trypsin eta-like n=1 Tax=Eurosta solidaginis TaxID=178769 RepID=UPI0035315DCD